MRTLGRTAGTLRAALAAGMALLALSGASKLRARSIPEPREDIVLSLRDKVIRDISSAGLTLSFRIAVANRAATDRALVRYRYRVVVNQKEFLNMSVGLDEPLAVPAGQETLIALPVKITYALLVAAVGPVETSGRCEVAGEMVFADERKREDKVGFAFPGEFPVFKDPEVELLPLKVNDLTVGGADLVFSVRFRNPNAYELVVSRMSYRLLFGEKVVQAGLVPGDKSLPRTGEKVFDFPLVLDFFETGTETRDLLQKPPVPSRFAGELEITSAWGTLVVPFDKTLAVAEER